MACSLHDLLCKQIFAQSSNGGNDIFRAATSTPFVGPNKFQKVRFGEPCTSGKLTLVSEPVTKSLSGKAAFAKERKEGNSMAVRPGTQ